MRVTYTCADEVAAAILAIGRTEDIQVSPDGRRLAIAGFGKSYLLVLDSDIQLEADGRYRVHFGRALTVKSQTFALPHGMAWVNNETLVVANRNGAVPVLHLPRGTNAIEVQVHPLQTIGSTPADHLNAPGSVALRHLADEIVEVLICNNYSHTVSRHYLDGKAGLSILASEVVLQSGLDIPDGVVYSRTGAWVAVSNHYDNTVFIYRASQIGLSDRPAGILRGVLYPHGITFSPDDRAIFVADAGAPCVFVYGNASADWSGDHLPLQVIDVVEPDAFKAINEGNAEDGGTKGVVLTADGGLLCVTCEQEPLFFSDVRELLASHGLQPSPAPDSPLPPAPDLRMLMAKARRGAEESARRAQGAEEPAKRVQVAESRVAELEAEIHAIRNSRTWRALGLWRSLRGALSRKQG